MIDLKAQIFAKLSELVTDFPELSVFQVRPETIESLPTITFRIEDDRPQHTLDKEIGYQVAVIRIDIWANTSVESGELLVALEAKMRAAGYLLGTHFDVPEEDLSSHVTTQFNFLV